MLHFIQKIFGTIPILMGAKNNAKKLSKKDYELLLSQLRKLTPHIRDLIVPLVHHTQYCHNQLDSLESELRDLKQRHFFESPKPQISESGQTWKKETKVFSPLKERLKAMLDNGHYGSDAWKRTLKWNDNMSDQTALNIAKGDQDHHGENQGPQPIQRPIGSAG